MGFFLPLLFFGEMIFGAWSGMYLTPHIIIVLVCLHLLLIRAGDKRELEGIIFWMPGYMFFVGLVFGGLMSVDWPAFWNVVSPHLLR